MTIGSGGRSLKFVSKGARLLHSRNEARMPAKSRWDDYDFAAARDRIGNRDEARKGLRKFADRVRAAGERRGGVAAVNGRKFLAAVKRVQR